jgi:hypothetical protein
VPVEEAVIQGSVDCSTSFFVRHLNDWHHSMTVRSLNTSKPLLQLWGYTLGLVAWEVSWERSVAALEEYSALQRQRAYRAGQAGGMSHCWTPTGENMIEVVTLNPYFRDWDFSKLRIDPRDRRAWVGRQAFHSTKMTLENLPMIGQGHCEADWAFAVHLLAMSTADPRVAAVLLFSHCPLVYHAAHPRSCLSYFESFCEGSCADSPILSSCCSRSYILDVVGSS